MSLRWLWWSILGACLATLFFYALSLAVNRLNMERPSARARLVWSPASRMDPGAADRACQEARHA